MTRRRRTAEYRRVAALITQVREIDSTIITTVLENPYSDKVRCCLLQAREDLNHLILDLLEACSSRDEEGEA